MTNAVEPDYPENPTLAELQEYIAAVCTARGFDIDNVPKKFMMVTEELGELAKAARKKVGMKLADNKKAATDNELAHEAADVFIVLIGLCNMMGIDIEKAIREKEAHNKTRTWQ